jgi:hypothetical protein
LHFLELTRKRMFLSQWKEMSLIIRTSRTLRYFVTWRYTVWYTGTNVSEVVEAISTLKIASEFFSETSVPIYQTAQLYFTQYEDLATPGGTQISCLDYNKMLLKNRKREKKDDEKKGN